MGISCGSWTVMMGFVLWTSTAAGQDGQDAARVNFECEIAPILAARCIECHGPDKQKEGLRLDRAAFTISTRRSFTCLGWIARDGRTTTRGSSAA